MSYKEVSFEKRIKENIKDYAIRNLFAMDMLEEYLKVLADDYGMELLLTDRHGEEARGEDTRGGPHDRPCVCEIR